MVFQNGGRPPSWICYVHFWTTNDEYLVILMTVQTLVEIDAVVSITQVFNEFGLKMPIHAPNGDFLGNLSSNWRAVTSRPQKGLPCAQARHTMYIGPPVFALLTLLPNPPKSHALQWASHSPKSAPSRCGICTLI